MQPLTTARLDLHPLSRADVETYHTLYWKIAGQPAPPPAAHPTLDDL